MERRLAAVRQRLSGVRREVADREERMVQANRQLSQLVNGQLGAASPYMAAFDQQVLLCQRLDAALREQRTRWAVGARGQRVNCAVGTGGRGWCTALRAIACR